MEIARELQFESEDEYVDSEEEFSQEKQELLHSWLENGKYSQNTQPVSKLPEVVVSETEDESDQELQFQRETVDDQEVQSQDKTMMINETLEASDDLIENSQEISPIHE